MQNLTDYLLDRKSIKSKLAFWRNLAIFLGVLFFFNSIFNKATNSLNPITSPANYIARVKIEGLITSDQYRSEALKTIANDEQVKGVILHVNSPGGSPYGAEEIYADLRKLAEKKPLIVVMEDVATSAAYWLSLSGERILARKTTLTGSIGALMVAPDFSDLLDKIGVKVNVFKSGKLKAEPLPFNKIDENGKNYVQEVLLETFEIFINVVKSRRNLNNEALAIIKDGRSVTGLQAKKLGLIDEIGGEEEAFEWLVKTKKLDNKMQIKNVSLEKPTNKIEKILQITSNTFTSAKKAISSNLMVF